MRQAREHMLPPCCAFFLNFEQEGNSQGTTEKNQKGPSY